MNILLILRAEIVCLAILCFLLFCSLRYWENEEKGRFLKMCICALGHVIFDIITVITVNIPKVPVLLNDILHVAFYECAILFCFEFFCYVSRIVFTRNVAEKIAKATCILPIAYPFVVFFLDIEYLQGRGTNYSYGSSVMAGYGLAMLLFVVTLFMVVKHEKMDPNVRKVLLPVILLALAGIIVQIFVPELLFTGAAVTLIVMGMYFAIENPVDKYKRKAYFDIDTGVRNKNSFEEDVYYLNRKYREGERKTGVGYVICDLNGLKMVNDKYGHAEGDELIRLAAQVLTNHLRHAYRVYRIGGDEFAALNLDESYEVMAEEVATVRKVCTKVTTASSKLPLSVAIGYAVTNGEEYIEDICEEADKLMYENKLQMKAARQ